MVSRGAEKNFSFLNTEENFPMSIEYTGKMCTIAWFHTGQKKLFTLKDRGENPFGEL